MGKAIVTGESVTVNGNNITDHMVGVVISFALSVYFLDDIRCILYIPFELPRVGL